MAAPQQRISARVIRRDGQFCLAADGSLSVDGTLMRQGWTCLLAAGAVVSGPQAKLEFGSFRQIGLE